uniref:Fatty acid hydroxylase domain-containing protein n=1 Tax=Nelumbo nucifera TaxID=4432 RepID=A0A822ZJI7_NELNU|nr:TPA_asm: hypothetical protein HUJ06_003267 [Nelumbo nucifera]
MASLLESCCLGLPFIYLVRAGYLSKYKIQSKNNTPAAQDKCVTRLLLYHIGVNLPVMILSYPVFRYMGMRSSLPLPSWNVVSLQILLSFILEDFVFYRILHTKWLYKHAHSVHHEYATPFGLTSEYAHPAEILFLGFPTIVGPAIIGPIVGTISLGAPQICFLCMEGNKRLRKLEALDMNYFNTTIFQYIGLLAPNIKTLYLSGNDLSGPITDQEVSTLSELEFLDFSFTSLSYDFLQNIGEMVSL